MEWGQDLNLHMLTVSISLALWGDVKMQVQVVEDNPASRGSSHILVVLHQQGD